MAAIPAALDCCSKMKSRLSFEECLALLNNLAEFMTKWKKIGVNEQDRWGVLSRIVESVQVFFLDDELLPVDRQFLGGSASNDTDSELDDLLAKVRNFQSMRNSLLNVFKEDAFHLGVAEICDNRENLESNWFIIRHPFQHWKLQNKIESLYKRQETVKLPQMSSDLEELEKCLELRNQIRSANVGANSLGRYWQAEETDLGKLRQALEWRSRFLECLDQEILHTEAMDYVCSVTAFTELRQEAAAFQDSYERLMKFYRSLESKLRPNYRILTDNELESIPLRELADIWCKWHSNLDQLHAWRILSMKIQEAGKTISAPIVRLLVDDSIQGDDLLPHFQSKHSYVHS